MEILNSKNEICICNDETQTKKVSCFKCNNQWDEKKDYDERINDCPIHQDEIEICSIHVELCDECKAEGYYLKNYNYQLRRVLYFDIY